MYRLPGHYPIPVVPDDNIFLFPGNYSNQAPGHGVSKPLSAWLNDWTVQVVGRLDWDKHLLCPHCPVLPTHSDMQTRSERVGGWSRHSAWYDTSGSFYCNMPLFSPVPLSIQPRGWGGEKRWGGGARSFSHIGARHAPPWGTPRFHSEDTCMICTDRQRLKAGISGNKSRQRHRIKSNTCCPYKCHPPSHFLGAWLSKQAVLSSSGRAGIWPSLISLLHCQVPFTCSLSPAYKEWMSGWHLSWQHSSCMAWSNHLWVVLGRGGIGLGQTPNWSN